MSNWLDLYTQGDSTSWTLARAFRDQTRAARDEVFALAPLSPASFANLAAAVTEALGTGRALVLRPGDNATIHVPAQRPTIEAAYAAISAWSIPRAASVKIKVADGAITASAPLVCDHPDGARIFIEGNPANPDAVPFTYLGPADYLYTGGGQMLGGFNGFRLTKAGLKAGCGIVSDGGFMRVGPNLIIDNFYYGIASRHKGLIRADGTSSSNRILILNPGDVGGWAYVGGTLTARYARCEGASDAERGLGYGFLAEYGGTVEAQYAEAAGCLRAGMGAYRGEMRAYDTIVEDNIGNGYEADGGSIVAHRGISRRNGGWGAFENDSGNIEANPDITYEGNALGTIPGRWERFTSAGQAGFRALRGAPGRLDVADTLFVNGTGGPILRVQRSGVPALYPSLIGAPTGGRVRLTVDGSDAARGLDLMGGGEGSVRFGEAGSTAYLEVDDADAAQIRLAARGKSWRLDTDAGRDIFLNPGGGNALAVRAGGVTSNVPLRASAAADAAYLEVNAADGYYPILRFLEGGAERSRIQHNVSTDMLELLAGAGGLRVNTSGGTQIEILNTLAAVNRAAITGAPTGANARISAIGADANVGLDLVPKASGVVRLVGETAQRGLAVLFSAGADTILRGVNPTNNLLRPLTIEAEDWTVRIGTTGEASAGTTRLRINTTGIGLHGATPVAKATITGSRSSGAALLSLLGALVARGDFNDGTTT